MTFSLGRVGLASSAGGDGLTMAEPLTWDQSGETVTLRGIQDARSLAANNYETNLLWWREQMLGLGHEIGEDAVPVRSTVVSGFDGYYRVVDVGVNHPEGSLNSGTLQATWAIALERLPSWRQPRHELVGAFGLLVNSYSIGGYLVSAVPPGTFDWTQGDAFSGGTQLMSRSVDRGDGTATTVSAYRDSSPDSSGQYIGRFLGDIDFHYQGACRVEYDAAGNGTYRQVVGYRTFDDATSVTGMRLSNGMVRATIGGTNNVEVRVSHWDGTQWDTTVATNIVYLGTSSNLALLRAQVLRNAPTLCVVRFYCQLATSSTLSDGTFTVDLSIRRGLRAVFVRVSRTGQWRLQFASATASSTIVGAGNGAIRETSNNSGGNRVILTAQDASTVDTVNGRISQPSSSDQFLAAVTCEVGGTGATATNQAIDMVEETFILASETQRTVAY